MSTRPEQHQQTEIAPAPQPTAAKQSLLERIAEQQAEVASRYQPVMDIDDAGRRYDQLKNYIEKRLFEGEDYGRVPGVEKPFLFKSGAQKLCMLFGYAPHYEALTEIEDWSGTMYGEPLFYYKYSCVLYKNGQPVGEGIGSANSWESKYRYRWVSEAEARKRPDFDKLQTRGGTVSEFAFAIDKGETSGQYGKPAEYWQRWKMAIAEGSAKKIKRNTSKGKEMDAWEMGGSLYRIPNDGFPDVINTCQKQGEKRAYVEATLSATGASQFFTQDEDAVQALPTAPAAAEAETGGKSAEAAGNGKELPAKLPEELEGLFGDQAPEKGALTACEIVKRELNEALGEAKGGDEYRRVMALNKVVMAAGKCKSGDLRTALLQGWTTARQVKAAGKPAAAVEDAGPAKFGQEDDWDARRE